MASAERWVIRRGDGSRSRDRIDVGAEGWTLPTWYAATLDHSSEPFLLGLRCTFNGFRVEVKEVVVKSRNGRSITSRDLSAVELAAAVYRLAESEVQPEHPWPADRRAGRRMDDDELRLLASVYAFQFAAWGNPRQAVMGYWDLPRATANRWIRKAREMYPSVMPGDGGDTDGERGETP